MKQNFQVILFKNNKKKKIFKSFVTKKKALEFFEKKMNESHDVKFYVEYENAKEANYKLLLTSNSFDSDFSSIYYKDYLGRTISVDIKIEENLYIQRIEDFRIEDFIYDLNKNLKISIQDFHKNYLKSKEFYMLSKINNKLVVQKDEDFKLFSFKNESDVERFVESLMSITKNFMYVSDVSSPQKKYIYKILEENGFKKQMLYRKYTTHPKQK